ncbi:MAG: hypothetical protein LQ344_002420 [Seirophora lacunosa]|nr:MAG: hypothetical protein LQ344_002420 [Seirophora lacunosa]
MQRVFDRGRQLLQETRGERRARTDEGFQRTERSLPRLTSAFDIPLAQNISSYLGPMNPLAGPVDPATESVWLFDATAYHPVHPYPHAQQPWQVDIRAAFFKKGTGRDVSKIVADIADKVGLSEGEGDAREQGERTIAERLQPFADAVAPGRWVQVRLPDGKTVKLGPGGRSATIEQTISTRGEHREGETVSIGAVKGEITPYGPMEMGFAEEEGWMVISDIDDTIKTTLTPDPTGILRTTFLLPASPIAGMPALYTHMHAALSQPTWFYLSASPYNLHPFLHPFMRATYPRGPILLRDASWMDLSGFLASLTQGTQAYKRARIERLHRMLPRRKVLCVGDSTQSDPEAYGDIYRLFGGAWIKRIFIRKVTDIAQMDGAKNEPERFEKAFCDVPRGVWTVFEDPAELYDAVDGLVAAN